MPPVPRSALVVFAAAVLVLAYLTHVSESTVRESLAASARVAQTQEILRRLNLVTSNLARAESATRGFVLAGDALDLGDLNRSTAAAEFNFAEAERLTTGDSLQRQRLRESRSVLADKVQVMHDIVEARRANDMEGVLALTLIH